MSEDDDRLEPQTLPPTRGVSLLYLASALALAGALLAAFLTVYTSFEAGSRPTYLVIEEVYAALAVGLVVLLGQGLLVFCGLVRPLRQALLRVEQMTRDLDQHTHRDALTGALNRAAFERLIARELEALKRYRIGFCGIMLDVDGFRAVNEGKGYEAGDQVLAELGRLLKEHMRTADFLFRWRSGRFLVLASGLDEAQTLRFADKLRQLVAGHAFHGGVPLTLCQGVAQALPEDGPEQFVGRVKAALARAKEMGPGGLSGASGGSSVDN
jgi:diguanylate cyclase (GGDEF)-like protein